MHTFNQMRSEPQSLTPPANIQPVVKKKKKLPFILLYPHTRAHMHTHTHTHTFTHTLVTPGVALAPSCRPQHNDDDDEEKDEEPAFGYSGMLRLSVCVEQLCGVLTGVSVCVCVGGK